MNLLIFVLTFLLVISSMSYQAMGHFKANSQIRGLWERYLQIEEPCDFNDVVIKQYKKEQRTSATPKQNINADAEDDEEDDDDSDPAAKSIQASAGINFRFLTDTVYAAENPQEAELMLKVIQQLIEFMYGDQEFFRNDLLESPNLLDEWIPAIRQANESLEKNKPNSKNNLKKIVLNDPILNHFWFELQKANPVTDKVSKAMNLKNGEESLYEQCFKSSLINYLSDKKVKQLRLYLVSRPILIILLDRQVQDVESFIAKRREVASEIRKGMTLTQANLEFQNFAKQFSALSSYEPILNYEVSKTNPADYE